MSISSVSYTHLIYECSSKFQFLINYISFTLSASNLPTLNLTAFLPGIVTVSYTHLDVYKRQAYRSNEGYR